MKMSSASLFGRLCCGLSVAVLALAVSLDGTHAVWADDADGLATSLQEMIVDPFMKTVQGLEVRLTALETTVGAMAESFTSRRVVVQMLCVSDETGAQTCVTKAQLDRLLSGIARAEINQPSATATEANAIPTEDPVETIVTKDASQYPEQAGPVDGNSVAEQEPEHTGTVRSAPSGTAIVLYPPVEITEEPTPVEAAPAEPADPSDD
jgi:hypothetical protein